MPYRGRGRSTTRCSRQPATRARGSSSSSALDGLVALDGRGARRRLGRRCRRRILGRRGAPNGRGSPGRPSSPSRPGSPSRPDLASGSDLARPPRGSGRSLRARWPCRPSGTRGHVANGLFDRIEAIGDLIDLLLEPDDDLAQPSNVFARRHVHRLEIRSHVVPNQLLSREHGLEQLSARIRRTRGYPSPARGRCSRPARWCRTSGARPRTDRCFGPLLLSSSS